jgi:hypothetical protein
VLWRMTIILKANKVNLFVSSYLFVFWHNSPNFLVTPHMFHHLKRRSLVDYWPCGSNGRLIASATDCQSRIRIRWTFSDHENPKTKNFFPGRNSNSRSAES